MKTKEDWLITAIAAVFGVVVVLLFSFAFAEKLILRLPEKPLAGVDGDDFDLAHPREIVMIPAPSKEQQSIDKPIARQEQTAQNNIPPTRQKPVVAALPAPIVLPEAQQSVSGSAKVAEEIAVSVRSVDDLVDSMTPDLPQASDIIEDVIGTPSLPSASNIN